MSTNIQKQVLSKTGTLQNIVWNVILRDKNSQNGQQKIWIIWRSDNRVSSVYILLAHKEVTVSYMLHLHMT